MNTDVTKKMACSILYSTPPAVGTDSLDGAGAIASTNLIGGCLKYTYDPLFPTEYDCTVCDRTSEDKVVVTIVTTEGGSIRKPSTV